MRLASPALSLGLALLPVLTTMAMFTSGSSWASARMTETPLRRRSRVTLGSLKGACPAGTGSWLRKGASGVWRARGAGSGGPATKAVGARLEVRTG